MLKCKITFLSSHDLCRMFVEKHECLKVQDTIQQKTMCTFGFSTMYNYG